MDTVVRIPATQVKNQFGEILDKASRTPITITRHNRDCFVLMNIEDYRLIKEYAGKAFSAKNTPDELIELMELGLQQQLAQSGDNSDDDKAR